MDERPDLSSWWNLDEQTLYARLDCTGQGLNSLAVSRRQAQAPPRSRLAGL
jgi:Mg2+-importing ATPase